MILYNDYIKYSIVMYIDDYGIYAGKVVDYLGYPSKFNLMGTIQSKCILIFNIFIINFKFILTNISKYIVFKAYFI